MNRTPRIRLRTFFLVFFCAAIGLTIGTRPETEANKFAASMGVYPLRLDWHHACLAAASVAVVIGLYRQAIALHKLDLGNLRENGALRISRLFSSAWRSLCAGTLIVCLFTTLLLSRRLISLPDSEAIFTYKLFPDVIWIGCIILTLFASLTRWRPQRERRKSLPWRYLMFFLAGPLIVLLCLPEIGFVHYLVHIATQGIENAQPLAHRRAGEFPEHSAEGFRDFWISLAASVCVFLAAAFLFVANSVLFGRRRVKAFGITGFVTTIIIVTGYCVWYYSAEFHRISPYLAVAGAASNWLEQLVGIAIAFFCITAIAYQSASRGESNSIVVARRNEERDVSEIHESVACLLLLVVSAAIYLYEIAQAYAQYSISQSSGLRSMVEIVGNLCRDPGSLLMILVAVASIELCWLRWRRRTEDVEWKIGAIDLRRFAWNWAALALLAIVGIPTLSSFCFVYWLGPWQLYAP